MIVVTGASGFLGQAVCRELGDRPHVALTGRAECDLRFRGALLPHLTQPHTTVIHLAYPGTDGIGTMIATPADLVRDMVQIDLNVIEACAREQVQQLICVGSACAYPEHVTYPTGEDQLWSGYPEPTNAPYGVGKRMQLELLRAYRRQYGLQGVHLILGNLYGPGDRSKHVIPALIEKVYQAMMDVAPEVEVWGSGHATREFLYVEDAARAIVAAATQQVDTPDPINICTGEEVSIDTLIFLISRSLGYPGQVRWDPSHPDGQPRRRFSYVKAQALLGWAPQVSFTVGLQRTIRWWNTQPWDWDLA